MRKLITQIKKVLRQETNKIEPVRVVEENVKSRSKDNAGDVNHLDVVVEVIISGGNQGKMSALIDHISSELGPRLNELIIKDRVRKGGSQIRGFI